MEKNVEWDTAPFRRTYLIFRQEETLESASGCRLVTFGGIVLVKNIKSEGYAFMFEIMQGDIQQDPEAGLQIVVDFVSFRRIRQQRTRNELPSALCHY